MQNEKKAAVKKRKRKKHPMKILISLLAIFMLSDLCSKHGCYCHAESEAGNLGKQQ